MVSYPFHDWARLTGSRVEVRRGGMYVRTGEVDAATTDSTIIWLALEGTLGRVLIDKSQGYEIWIEPRQLREIATHRRAVPIERQALEGFHHDGTPRER